MATARKTKKAEAAPAVVEKKSIKGFGRNLACRDYQFAIGQTFEHEGEVAACSGGFHACDADAHPLFVFSYYPPATSRYCDVVQFGDMHSDDQIKIASAKITIGFEVTLHELIGRAVKYVFDRCTQKEGEHATGYQGAASATGDLGAASATGTQGAASATGDRGAASATGYRGAASATGYLGAASATGTQGAASATGYQGAASATGDLGAASATGDLGAASATGTQGAASATGDRGAASATGYRGAASATGTRGAALSSFEGTVRGAVGNALFAIERNSNLDIVSVAAGIVGVDGIEPDTAYVCKAGKLVAA